MHFDGATVLYITTLISLAIGALLLSSGSPRRGDPALRFWGAGDLLAALGILLLSQRGVWSDALTVDLANALIVLTYGCFWSGTRHFVRKPLVPTIIMVGPLLWLAACQVESFHESVVARLVLSSVLFAGYGIAACWELFRLPEKLPSKLPLLGVLSLHITFYTARIPLALMEKPKSAGIIHSPWIGVIATESLLFLVASSFLLVCLAKERSEGRERTLATLDPLTGVLNRRSFFDTLTAVLSKCHTVGAQAAVLMIDVDHFKQINDRFGHPAGDRALQAVASAIVQSLRAGDICGRIGGEEFACLLPRCSGVQALAVAERLRRSVSDIPDHNITVSVGAASTNDPKLITLEDVIGAADQALYQAKRAGRNRVADARAA
jgi:diguanylate cyclase (GGDEF)-like protein